MRFRSLPIRRKLMAIVVGTSVVVLLLTCTAFLAYEWHSFRQSSRRQLATLGEVIAANSTAVLAFANADDAAEVLGALKAERHIVAAALYDREGGLFARYPAELSAPDFPEQPARDGYRFEDGFLIGYAPVVQVQGSERLGTLYLRSDQEAMYERLRSYAGIAGLVILVLSVVAYLLSHRLQRQISQPILALAETAQAVSRRRDYSVRAATTAEAELGMLTEAFNHMLEQIEAKNAELEARVRARTMELEAANKELESFAYSVSHDLRTPLRAITGFAEILLRRIPEAQNPETHRCLELIHRGACEMDQLINSILAFSKLGHQALDRQPVDLAALGRQVFEELQVGLPARDVDFRVASLPMANASPGLMHQVLTNLLENALKFTRPRERAVIELGLGRPTPQGEAVFFVRDNGVGFDLERADKLFGVFQRLHPAKEFEGTGVGLAMVRRIIERHGGRVWADAMPDEGATFYFTLPDTHPVDAT